ncbi:MAG: hypothetical protein HY064_15105 [Bacteroidetes bacterium]|nr:hypothetical protein [Bacteroidota bacterium]
MKVRSRFSNFRDKLQVFFLGLLFGLVLGGGFFVLKLDQYVKELSFYKSLTQQSDKADTDQTDLKTDVSKSKPKKIKKITPVSVVNDSSSNAMKGDSTLPSVFDVDKSDDGIVIRKDELIGQLNYTLHPLRNVGLDSAAAKEPNSSAGYVIVEFWRSPLNYRGYKFTRNKVVLFGLESGDVRSFWSGDNITYLKSTNGIYKLDVTSDFHQLERVTDEILISRMQ